jgi:iron complex transport system substrate-binding protein
MKKITALLMSLIVLLALIAGCSSANTSSTSPAGSPSASATSDSPSQTSPAASGATQIITDMAGRQVTVPTTVKSVYCAVPTAEAMITSLCPDKLIGWVNKPSDVTLKYLPSNLANIPVIGGWMGQQVTANIENIVSLAPDVIIYMGTNVMSNADKTPDDIQKKTNIPVVVCSSKLTDTAAAYRFLGQVLGVSDRAETLAAYSEKKIDEIKADVAKVPDAAKVTVYYAEGKGGLSTDPTGSDHTEVLDLINVTNVANVEKLAGQGMTAVSIEQVISWNPSVILVSGQTLDNYKLITTSDSWKKIQAVQDNKVYVAPTTPFNWFDRPPDVMRIIAISWFANKIYPDYVKIDANQEIKDFFKTFYGATLSDSDVQAILATPSAG